MARWQWTRCRHSLPESHFADPSITQTARSLGTCASAPDLPKEDWEAKELKHNETLNKQIISDRFHCVALAGLHLVM